MTRNSQITGYTLLCSILVFLLLLSCTAAVAQNTATRVSHGGEFTSPVTAKGELLIVEGRVTDSSGTPLVNGSVEIWQTDTNGIYDHPGDRKTARRDRGFQFFGSSRTDSNGNYVFRTIVPGKYAPRPPHIHALVRDSSNKVILTTQIYFREDGSVPGTGGSVTSLQVPIQQRSKAGQTERFAVFPIVAASGNPGILAVTQSQAEGPFYPRHTVSKYDNDLASVDSKS